MSLFTRLAEKGFVLLVLKAGSIREDLELESTGTDADTSRANIY